MFLRMGIFSSLFKPKSIPDPLDILFYVLGTIMYWIIYTNLREERIIH